MLKCKIIYFIYNFIESVACDMALLLLQSENLKVMHSKVNRELFDLGRNEAEV